MRRTATLGLLALTAGLATCSPKSEGRVNPSQQRASSAVGRQQ